MLKESITLSSHAEIEHNNPKAGHVIQKEQPGDTNNSIEQKQKQKNFQLKEEMMNQLGEHWRRSLREQDIFHPDNSSTRKTEENISPKIYRDEELIQYEATDQQSEIENRRIKYMKETRKKIAALEDGQHVDFSRKHMEGVSYSELMSSKNTGLFNTLNWMENRINKIIENKNLVEPLRLTERQNEEVEKIRHAYDRYLIKYNCSCPDFNRENIYMIHKIDQFGIGGADSILGNYIYLTQLSLEKDRFPYVFAHEFGHFIGVKSFRKDGDKMTRSQVGLLREKLTLNIHSDRISPESILRFLPLNEGFTDLFALRILKEINIDVPEEKISKAYRPYRQIVHRLAEKIGQGDFDKGFDMLAEAHLTGNDKPLIDAIDGVFSKDGGYDKFLELLDNLQGIGNPLNRIKRATKTFIRIYTKMLGTKIDFFKLENSKEYKKMIEFLD